MSRQLHARNLAKKRLSDLNIRRAKLTPRGKQYRRLYDGDGLFLVITYKSKLFYFQYSYNGKTKQMPIGRYPDISLPEARKACLKARLAVLEGINPNVERKIKIAENIAKTNATFEVIAKSWYDYVKPQWRNEKHKQQVINTLTQYAFPIIGQYPISQVPKIECFKVIEGLLNKPATALRVKQRMSAVFEFAIQTGRATENPIANFPKIIRTPEQRSKKHLALPKEQIGEFLVKCDKYPNRKLALMMRLLVLTFVRSFELRMGEWSEIKGNEWHIPAERMKMKKPHIVPLSDWALETLKELKELAPANSPYFCILTKPKPMSESTLLQVMNKLGYKGIAVPHGFRAMASTILNESGKFSPDAIERQLSHSEQNEVRAAYNRAEYIEERHIMMQWYSNRIRKFYYENKFFY